MPAKRRYLKTGLIALTSTVFLGGLIGLIVNVAHAEKPTVIVPKPIVVEAAKVGRGDIPTIIEALGTLSAMETVTLGAKTDGRVASIYFKNGQSVTKGMPVLQQDNAQQKADYDAAVAELKMYQMKYKRSKLLINQAISQQDLADIKATLDTKKAEVQRNQAILDQKQVTAPFSGVLGEFKVSSGDFCTAGQAIVTLVNISQLRVEYTVPECYLPLIKQGQLVQLKTSTYPDKIFYGTVNFLSPTVNSDTHAVSVQALVPNDKSLLSPGMFTHIKQQVAIKEDVLVVPVEAVLVDVKGYYVYKLHGNKANQTYIKIGERTDDHMQVLSGLKEGDIIVSAGQQKLDDGSIVKVANKL